MTTLPAYKTKRSGPERPGKFRVLVGSHLAAGPEGCGCDDCARGLDHVYESYATHLGRVREANRNRPAGEPPMKNIPPQEYTGDVIDSPVDLVARFNTPPNSIKFERWGETPLHEAAAMRRRIEELEAENALLRGQKQGEAPPPPADGEGDDTTARPRKR